MTEINQAELKSVSSKFVLLVVQHWGQTPEEREAAAEAAAKLAGFTSDTDEAAAWVKNTIETMPRGQMEQEAAHVARCIQEQRRTT